MGGRRLNLVGQRFGKLVVVAKSRSVKVPSGTVVKWLCKCDCGNEIEIRGAALRSGNTTSCGCRQAQERSLVGLKFGRLTILEQVPSREYRGQKHSKWLCRCDCGNTTIAGGHDLRKGSTISCGCVCAERGRAMLRKAPGESGFRQLLKSYMHSARKRGISWRLTDEEFKELTKANCYYCNRPPRRTSARKGNAIQAEHSAYMFSGVDRVDSRGDYSKANCVPACTNCNMAKRDLPPEEWEAWIADLTSHYNSRLNKDPK